MRFSFSSVLVVLLFLGQSVAQAANAEVKTFHVGGMITDPNDARIPRVAVAFTGTTLNKNVASDGAGIYKAELPFGAYTMTAEHEGFGTYHRPLFCVNSPKALTFDFTLPIEEQIETVNIGTVSAFRGEESFPAGWKHCPKAEVRIRYEHRVQNAQKIVSYRGEDDAPDWDPVFVAYNLFSLSAHQVTYDAKKRVIRARGNVTTIDESGARQKAEFAVFQFRSGEARRLQ
jgi:hypothetical protein